jgi:hypothetical protein
MTEGQETLLLSPYSRIQAVFRLPYSGSLAISVTVAREIGTRRNSAIDTARLPGGGRTRSRFE